MPQIFLMISPDAQQVMTEAAILRLDWALSRLVRECLGVPVSDIAFSAVNLSYARNEANLQVEVRYTAGTDEYGKGEPFDPSEEVQKILSAKMEKAAQDVLAKRNLHLTVSVWMKPFYRGTFRLPGGGH